MIIQFANVSLFGNNSFAKSVRFKYVYNPDVPLCIYDAECGETVGKHYENWQLF